MIMLNKREDWHAWLEMIRHRSLMLDIWRYIDPGLPTQPAEPVAPPEPERTVTDPDWYELELQMHGEFMDARYQIIELLAQTVHGFYQSNARGKTTLWEILRALQDEYKPSTLARQLSLIDQLNRLKKGPNRAGLDEWLNEWQGYLVDATEVDLPEVKDGRAQLDFLLAVQKFNKTWANLAIYSFMNEEMGNQTSLLELISQYRMSRDFFPDENVTRGRTDHALSAQNSFEDGNHSATARDEPETAPTLQGRKPSRRPFRECVCGKLHWYHECWYLIEAIRPRDWVPDADIMKEVQRILERDSRLRSRVNKAKNKASNLRSSKKRDSKGP